MAKTTTKKETDVTPVTTATETNPVGTPVEASEASAETPVEVAPVVPAEPATPVETKTVTPVKHKFTPEEPIECVSIASGTLGMVGIKSGINYRWAGRGDVTEVEYQDLVAAVRAGKGHITLPLFIIQNEDFLKEFPQVEKVYASMYSIQDLKDVFSLSPAQMKKVIMELPEGAKNSLRNIASTEISHGRLDSVQKIKVLDEIFDTKFMLMTELFD